MPILGKKLPTPATISLKKVWRQAKQEGVDSLMLTRDEMSYLRDPVRTIRASANYYNLRVTINARPEGFYVTFLNDWDGSDALD